MKKFPDFLPTYLLILKIKHELHFRVYFFK